MIRYLGPAGGGGVEGCGLLTAVAANLQTMAAEILTEWTTGDASFARRMVTPGPDNPYVEDHAAGTLAFFRASTTACSSPST